jgi:flagellar motor switch protein FliN/FliY
LDVNTKEPEEAVETEKTPAAEEHAAEVQETAVPEEAESPSGTEPPGEVSGDPGDPDSPEEPGEGTAVRKAEFQPLSGASTAAGTDNLRIVMDVIVPVTIELGATELPLRKILELGPGSIVRLDRSLGEPADILVNGELVGRGEVVVVDDQFGVRVTELLNPDAGCSS